MTEAATFVDTDILAHAHNASEADEHARARALLERLWTDRSGVVSTQVLSEFYDVMTQKATPPMTPAAALEVVNPLASEFDPALPTDVDPANPAPG